MQKHGTSFTKTRLAASLSIALGVSSVAPVAMAQEASSDDVEVINVKGVRGSLIRSMDVKRSSDGIVDVISAEDMGKFPDTNLAESMQRITGVAIDRSKTFRIPGDAGGSVTRPNIVTKVAHNNLKVGKKFIKDLQADMLEALA